MKTIVAVDVDGVLANIHDVWLARYNKDYNDNFTVDQWVDWGIHKFVKPECGIKIYDYIEDPSIYDDALPIPYAQEAIEFMKEHVRIIFVTNSTVGTFGAKYKWLRKYGFLDNQDDYVECKDKSLIFAHQMIDDNIDNLNKFLGPQKYLYTQPWNKDKDCEWRIYDWKDFMGD